MLENALTYLSGKYVDDKAIGSTLFNVLTVIGISGPQATNIVST